MNVRRLLLLLAAVAVLTVPRLLAQEARGVIHTSEAGKFRVTAPGRMKEESKDLATGPTLDQTVRVSTERVDGPHNAIYSVTVADYPEQVNLVAAKVLDGVCGGLKGPDGKFVEEPKELTLTTGDQKVPGRAVRVEAGKNVIRARVYLDHSRLYLVMVTGTKTGVTGPAADDFLKSFEIVK
ncbi:hypothetical protein [Fimbriiglobus ruber]|uniref:Uncharacterized protein n=1 Tax=Fimbriiglobus ruber TaxID=1908690 RepID=A0A225EA46_9BACT|nr:hypothetical protein [Fimbriiglobus ruber]OWK45435.1 hypothetical protein FRUB_01766 [Fimbriiglobus ruber]